MCYICGSNGLGYTASVGGGFTAVSGDFDSLPQFGGGGSNFWAYQGSTGSVNINGLLSGDKWGGTTLTYSFPSSTSQYESGYSEIGTGFFAAPAATQAAIRFAMNLVSQYTNLVTTEVNPATTTADVRVAFADLSAHFTGTQTAYAYYPSDSTTGGDIWYGNYYTSYQNPIKGQYAWATTIHELGHALGMKHGHQTGGPSNTAMETAYDQMAYSIMTYRSYLNGPTSGYTNEQNGYAQTFMMYDIAALQTMYGANFNTNSGNTTYTWSSTTGEMFINGTGQGAPGGNRIFMTLWDGNGVDTYDFSNYTSNLTVNLTPGAFSITSTTQLANLGNSQYAPGNIFNALQYNGDVRSLIENAIGGSGSDTITGNAANNYLFGNAGNDTINGGSGNDVIRGGLGADTLTGGANNDLFYFIGTDMSNGTVDSVTDGGKTLEDLIWIDAVQHFNLTFNTVSGHARITVNYAGSNYGHIDILTAGTGPVIVATNSSVNDPTTLNSSMRNNVQLTWYDWANTTSYTQYTDIYNSGGARERQFGTYDGSNGRWDFYWDPNNTNSTWSYRFDYFNSSNQQTSQQGGYDAGGSWIQNYDTAGSANYSYYITYYNAAGAATQLQSFYDSGPNSGGRGITTWDVSNTQSYSEYTTYYDSSGNADTQNGTYDGSNGRWWVDFDQNNTQAWQSYTVIYNNAGTITQQWLTMDNGTIVYL